MSTKPLTEALFSGENDLMTTLVSSNVNCTTCIYYPGEQYINLDPRKCNKFISVPEISLCFKWRDGRNPETKKKFDEGEL